MDQVLSRLIGQRIRTLRLDLELTAGKCVTQMAKFGAPIASITWYQWEGGQRSITIPYLPAVAKVLGVTVPELVDVHDEIAKAPVKKKKK